MRDTSPDIDTRYRAMLLARSGEERLQMAASMHATARALVMASVREAKPDITPARLRKALFLRFYGHEYDDDARERILARLATETGMVLRRRVPINWDDLEIALTWRSDDIKPFLDLRTGTIRHYALSAFGIDAEELGLTEDEADRGEAEGYLVRIEPIESSVEYGWMEEFIGSVTDVRLRQHLSQALQGRRPFRRFKDALAASGAERERWFRFHDQRVRDAAREWMAAHDIEPTTAPDTRAT
jgi:hypothetical protein